MRYGSPYGAGYGSPDNHVFARMERNEANTDVLYFFTPRAGLGNAWFGIYRNARLLFSVYVEEGETAVARVPIPWAASSVSVVALRHGHCSDPAYRIERVAAVYEAVENRRVSVQFDFKPAFDIPPEGDGGYTSAWSLSGLVQGRNCRFVEGFPTWGQLDFDIEIDGGNATVTVHKGGYEIAAGTAAIGGTPFTVTLAQRNGSGVAGSVLVSNTVAAVADATLDFRWPREMQILRDTEDPPAEVVDTVPFEGKNTARWTEPADLDSGDYWYATRPVSDTGDLGTESASLEVSVLAAPAAPADVMFIGGDAAATILGFSPSPTPGATHRLYLQEIGGELNLNDPDPAGTVFDADSVQLPAIAGYPGVARAIVRAVKDGVEERNLAVLEIEYDAAGDVVGLRPNPPGISRPSVRVEDGRTLSLRGTYDSTRELGQAVALQLFYRTKTGFYGGGGSHDFSAPAGQQNLQQAIGPVKYAELEAELPSNGRWIVGLLAATEDGTQSDPARIVEIEVFVSDEDAPAAENVTAELARI
ncbi:MAG: hypothetical protein KIS92_00820 [Planctomycetota bacterium]|nr:hypothetical protein [Planctomycetota bacterium]